MSAKPSLTLLHDLAAEFQAGESLLQVAILCGVLLLAYGLTRHWRLYRQTVVSSLPALGPLPIRDSSFVLPFLGWLFVALAKAILQAHGASTHLLSLSTAILGALALVRGIIHVLRLAFQEAAWLRLSERMLSMVVWGWLVLELSGLAPYVETYLEQVGIHAGKQFISVWQIIDATLVILGTLLICFWVSSMLDSRLARLTALDTSLRLVLARSGKAVVTLLGLLVGLSLLGIDVTALSVFTGALGVGLGFGLQKITSNYVSGFILLLDRSIQIGNVVQLDEQTAGIVTLITTRYTVIRQVTGVECIIPNEHLINSIVRNQSYSDRTLRLSTQIGVAYQTDLALAMRLMTEAAQSIERVLKNPAPMAALVQFQDSAILLELVYWIADPELGTLDLRSDVNLKVWAAFQANGIIVPFPQAEVRILGTPTGAPLSV